MGAEGARGDKGAGRGRGESFTLTGKATATQTNEWMFFTFKDIGSPMKSSQGRKFCTLNYFDLEKFHLYTNME